MHFDNSVFEGTLQRIPWTLKEFFGSVNNRCSWKLAELFVQVQIFMLKGRSSWFCLSSVLLFDIYEILCFNGESLLIFVATMFFPEM